MTAKPFIVILRFHDIRKIRNSVIMYLVRVYESDIDEHNLHFLKK